MLGLIGLAALGFDIPVLRQIVGFIFLTFVPGILILKPDYPENMDDWPFLWGENEGTIGGASQYIFLAIAAQELLGK